MSFLSKLKILNWKPAFLTLALVASLFQTACNDGQIIAGLYGATLGAMVVSTIANSNREDDRYERCVSNRRRERCFWERDEYTGRRVKVCESYRRDSCTRTYHNMSLAGDAPVLDASMISKTFQVPNEGAERIVNALTTAKNAKDDATAREALGTICLNIDELKGLRQADTLSDQTVDCMAKAINQDPKQTRVMVDTIIETARAQQALMAEPNI